MEHKVHSASQHQTFANPLHQLFDDMEKWKSEHESYRKTYNTFADDYVPQQKSEFLKSLEEKYSVNRINNNQ